MAVHKLIDREIAKGVSSERIFLIGFSQGGAVNYQAALTYDKPLGGLIALSSFFPTSNAVTPHPANQALPILVCHGAQDQVLNITLAHKSVASLQSLGYQPKLLTYPMAHTVCIEQIGDISDWLSSRL